MNSETRPSAQTLPGISRQRNRERGCSGMALLNALVVIPAQAGSIATAISTGCGVWVRAPSLARSPGRQQELSCFFLGGREALIEALALRGEIEQQLVRRKARAVFLLQLAAQRRRSVFVPIMSI